MTEKLLDKRQVAEYIGDFKPRTVEKWWYLGRGPVF